jgi:hypothetical protein
MEAVKGGAGYGGPRGGSSAVTAKTQTQERAVQPAGWDPFEVWRTRVRDVQQARARDGDASGKR